MSYYKKNLTLIYWRINHYFIICLFDFNIDTESKKK